MMNTAVFGHGLAKILSTHQLLDQTTLHTAIQDARNQAMPLVSHLVAQHLLPASTIANLLSQTLGLTVMDLDDWHEALPDDLDEKLITRHRVLPLQRQGQWLKLAMSDPTNQEAIDAFRFATRLHIEPVLVEEDKLSQWLQKQHFGTPIELDGEEIIENTDDDTTILDTPTVKFVNKILTDAIKLQASDIHFEPYETQCRIRYRIDGVMHTISTLANSHANKIAARLKIMASLDISERRKPQDGRIKLPISEHKSVDFRVSTLPTLFGEKVVLRILDGQKSLIDIDKLGLNDIQKQQFLTAINKPQGMILITGPTGSGKTVSLYTALSLLNQENRNILSAEDPVEIYLNGINQVNINPKIGLDFPEVLRAFLRQDPDVIMVGEIRDTQTAQIAIKAAQTGHLVLSTLHTNSSSEAVGRLHSMGVVNFLLADSVSLIIAQRLARKLCSDCKRPITIPRQSLSEAGFSPAQCDNPPVIFEAVGCHRCRDGYRGRIGVFECLPITPDIADMIIQQKSSQDIAKHNFQAGNLSLKQSALQLVADGIISLQEMYRVIHD
ncbi:type IV-A pilus assembly ATPase PilB [Moraxella nasicaprae]|uniref:Type IV-A pilus assembly ATPase PilB n=1 Tax=Moraxella nasicaprae TaxID=2904122 RepID=A0ABY6F253_9GAMM|nr:type IV-A pilus assembly ATPase PilB [Moraxella nasicaprae]UXZ04146.1 type IV-A pilus assembly ATPase PilB [Moraxella nasicaprae]